MNRIKVSKVAKQIRGVSYKPEDLHDMLDDNSVTLLRANNIQDGKVDFEDVLYVDKSKVSQVQYLQRGDILVCASSGSKSIVGKAASIDFDGEYTFGAFCKVVRPIPEMIDYLGIYFQSQIYRDIISKAAMGANINNIRNEHIDNLEIPQKTLKEISSIIQKIKLLQYIINCRKLELQKLDELVKARFVEMFGNPVLNDKGWKLKSLSNLTKKIGSGATPKGGKEVYQENGVAFIRSMNVYNGKFEYKELAYISDEQACKLDGVTVKEKDVLLNITGASVARSCVVPTDILPARVNQHVCIIRCGESIIPEFLNKILIDDNYQNFLWNIAGSGATREAITKQQVENLQIITPLIERQGAFVEFCKQIEGLKILMQRSLEQMKTLKKALMQQYFG